MIPKPTIVAVDDNRVHLDGITACLRRMGYACLPLQYKDRKIHLDDESVLDSPLNSIQLLFLDIEYIPGTPAGPQTYDMVVNILKKIMAPDNGPYVLVTWSTYPGQHQDLMDHLASELGDSFPAPAASALLDKSKFLADGTSINDAVLRIEIKAIIAACPQVDALMNWADAARTASGEVLGSLLKLLPVSGLYKGESGTQLIQLLSAIAKEGGGKNACNDLTSAMNEGLGPILFDRLIHATEEHREKSEEVWKAAIPCPITDQCLSDSEKSALNTMTSISQRDLENVPAGSRGAVCRLPENIATDVGFTNAFGGNKKSVLSAFLTPKGEEHGGLSKADRRRLCQKFIATNPFRLVGQSAACDHAWGKIPVKKLLLALEVPQSILEVFKPADHGAIYEIPLYELAGHSEPHRLIFNWRYKETIAGDMAGAEVVCRLREPLVSHLITNYHVYGFRPGIPSY